MSFDPSRLEEFYQIFNTAVNKIREFRGCLRVEIFRDARNPNVLFTISSWESEASLENYRKSSLFAETWAMTKPLFNGQPVAWSLESLPR